MVPYTAPLQSQLNASAIRALHADRSDHRAIQALASQTPAMVEGRLTKQHTPILEKLKRAGAIANRVVHEAADTANTGYGIWNGLKNVGREIWGGVKGLGSLMSKVGPAAAMLL
jgi:hypothetical protein